MLWFLLKGGQALTAPSGRAYIYSVFPSDR